MDIRIVGASLGAVALITGGYFLAVAPQNAATADTRAEAETISAESERTLATIPGLRAQLADIAPEVDYLRQLSTQVPPQINLPDLYAELDAAAAAAGIPSAENVTVSTPILVTPENADLPAPTDGSAPAPAPAPVEEGVETEEGAAAPAAPAANAAVIARYDVSLTVMGNPSQISAFLGALDNSGRMNTITATNITSGEDGRATIQAVFYLQQVDVDGIAQQIEDLVAVEAGQAPSGETPAEEAPAEEAPVEEAPIEEAPVGDLPAPTE